MHLSIIIPSLNNLTHLQICVNSIISQDFNDYEVLIIDGNSTDGTIKYLKSLNEPIQWFSNKDNGVYDAINKGLKIARGKWVYIIGCDDYIHHNFTFSKVFKQDISDDISLLLGKIKYKYINNDSYFIKRNNGIFTPNWNSKIWIYNTVHHQGTFYKRELFNSADYNLDYKIISDYDFNIKLFRNKKKALFLNQIIADCGTKGLSKFFNWKLYKEEIKIKTLNSSKLLYPFFLLIAILKYIVKQFS